MARCVFSFFSLPLLMGIVVSVPARALALLPNRAAPSYAQANQAPEREAPASLWAKAKAAMAQGNFAEAQRLLREAVQQDPKDGALWCHLVVSCTEPKNLDEAIAA